MAFLEHNGRTICYRLLGDEERPLFVLAHPLGMTQAVWDDMLPRLLQRFQVLSWDLPGHGGSAAFSSHCASVTPEDLVDDLLVLTREANVERFHFLGTSIGGVIGQQLISRHSHLLLSATLTNTGPVIGTPDAWKSRASDVRTKGLAKMAETIVPRWFGPQAVTRQPALVDGWKVLLSRSDDHSYALLSEMLGQCDFRDAFFEYQVPVALVGGRNDLATPPETLEALAFALRTSAPLIFENVGHVPSVENPGQLMDVIEQHMSP